MAVLIPSGRMVFQVGGVTFVDLNNMITLGAFSSSSGNYATFRQPNGTAGYAVTSAKTLKLYAMRLQSAATASQQSQLAYGDNDVGFNTSTVPTNPVYWIGSNSVDILETQTNSNQWSRDGELSIRFDIVATKYPFHKGNGTHLQVCTVFGYEV